MSTELVFEKLSGGAIAHRLMELAQLRITVFREWPYLYEGTLANEAEYLQSYIDCPRSLVVLVWDGARCVGASTCLPLADAHAEMRQPFEVAGMDLARIDYFGESVLLPEYRGRGLGVAFFKHREDHARSLGLDLCAFCAVDRDPCDRRKPAGYAGNDSFWEHRGYFRQPQLHCSFSWLDLGETEKSSKNMTFWLRQLPLA